MTDFISPPQRHPLIPERYSHSDVLDWLQDEIKADPAIMRAWMKKVSVDDAIPCEDRIVLLAETILAMAQDLRFFTPEGSREAQTAINIIQLAESIQP